MGLDDRCWLFQADALIRAHLRTDPSALTDEEWSHSLRMALWIESRYFEKLHKMLGR